MFYIKGIVGNTGKYLVKDTDDHSVEECTNEELLGYTKLGINVAGFTDSMATYIELTEQEILRSLNIIICQEILAELMKKRFVTEKDVHVFITDNYFNRVCKEQMNFNCELSNEEQLLSIRNIFNTGYRNVRTVTVVLSLSYYIQIKLNGNIDDFYGLLKEDYKVRGLHIAILKDNTILLCKKWDMHN